MKAIISQDASLEVDEHQSNQFLGLEDTSIETHNESLPYDQLHARQTLATLINRCVTAAFLSL